MSPIRSAISEALNVLLQILPQTVKKDSMKSEILLLLLSLRSAMASEPTSPMGNVVSPLKKGRSGFTCDLV